MKHFIALVLFLILCLSFSACGSQQTPADSPSDTAAASTDPVPAEETTIPEETDPYEAFYCSWVNLRGDGTMTLDDQGTAVFNGTSGTYEFEDNTLHITLPDSHVRLDITDHNGIPRLVSGWKYQDFVPETAAGAFAPYTVELTMDNWNTYFELYEAPTFGYINLVMPETGVPDFELRMKPEYVYKLLDAPNGDDSMSKLNPIFTFSYDALGYTYEKDDNGEFVFEFLEALDSAQQKMIPQPRECPVLDYRPFNMSLTETQSPVFVTGGWYAGSSWADSNGEPLEGTVIFPVNPAVTSVTGTLTFLP